jgi:DNA anti-recombination protein RmuC
VRTRWVICLASSTLAAALGGVPLAPTPVGAIAREIAELEQGVAQLRQRQKDKQTVITQNGAVEKTLIEVSLDSTSKLNGTKNALQDSVQELQSVSGSQLDTISIQVEGVSENVQVMLERIGKLNQQLTDAQNIIQGMGAKVGGNEARYDPLQRTKANRKRH